MTTTPQNPEASLHWSEAYMKFCENRNADHNEIGLQYFHAGYAAGAAAERERMAASCDRNYIAGAHAGFALGVENDNDGLAKLEEARRREIRAAQQPPSAAARAEPISKELLRALVDLVEAVEDNDRDSLRELIAAHSVIAKARRAKQ